MQLEIHLSHPLTPTFYSFTSLSLVFTLLLQAPFSIFSVLFPLPILTPDGAKFPLVPNEFLTFAPLGMYSRPYMTSRLVVDDAHIRGRAVRRCLASHGMSSITTARTQNAPPPRCTGGLSKMVNSCFFPPAAAPQSTPQYAPQFTPGCLSKIDPPWCRIESNSITSGVNRRTIFPSTKGGTNEATKLRLIGKVCGQSEDRRQFAFLM